MWRYSSSWSKKKKLVRLQSYRLELGTPSFWERGLGDEPFFFFSDNVTCFVARIQLRSQLGLLGVQNSGLEYGIDPGKQPITKPVANLRPQHLQYFSRHVARCLPGSSPSCILRAEKTLGTRLSRISADQLQKRVRTGTSMLYWFDVKQLE